MEDWAYNDYSGVEYSDWWGGWDEAQGGNDSFGDDYGYDYFGSKEMSSDVSSGGSSWTEFAQRIGLGVLQNKWDVERAEAQRFNAGPAGGTPAPVQAAPGRVNAMGFPVPKWVVGVGAALGVVATIFAVHAALKKA